MATSSFDPLAPSGAFSRMRVLRSMIGLCAAYCAANLSWAMQPFEFTALSNESAFGAIAAGWILSGEIVCAAVVSISVGYLSRRRATRAVLCGGALLIALCSVASASLTSFHDILLSRILAGAGTGVLIAAVTSAVAQLDQPETRYGRINAFMNLICFLLLLAMPIALRHLSFSRAVYAVLAVSVLVALPIIAMYPVKTSSRALFARSRGLAGLRGWLLCAAVFLFSLAGGSIYAVTEVLGRAMHVSGDAISIGVAIASIGAVVGSYITGWLDQRIGMYGGAFLVASGITAAAIILTHAYGAPAFIAAMLLFGTTSYFGFTICLGLAARLDVNGGCAAAVGGAYFLGGGLGPLLGGYELDWSVGAVGVFLWSAMVLMGAFFSLFLFVKRSLPTPAGTLRTT